MANRTVSVALELQAQQYKAEADAIIAKTMEMDREVEALDKDIKDLGPDAARAAAGMALLSAEHGKLGTQAEQAKTKVENIGEAIKNTDAEIERSKTLLQELAAEFGRTGDLDIVKKFTGEQSNVNRLTRMRSDLEGVKTDAEKAAQEMEKLLAGGGNKNSGGLLNFAIDEWVGNLAKGTKQGLQNGLNALSGTAPTGWIQWLIAGAVVAAPAIGAAINAGILLGVGGGGLALGIAGAIHSPAVQQAWSGVLQFLQDGLSGAAGSFIDPMVAAAGSVRATLSGVFTSLGHDLDVLAPSFSHLVGGLSGMVANLMPGLSSAFVAAAPIIDALAQELPTFGSAMSDFFSSIAAGGPGATTFFHDLMAFIDVTIIGVGKLVEGLSKAYDFLRNNPIGRSLTGVLGSLTSLVEGSGKVKSSFDLLKPPVDDAAASIGKVGLGATLASAAFSQLSGQISATAQTSATLAGAMTDKLLNTTLGLDQATLGFARAQTTLSDAIKQNGLQLDIHTAKGQANIGAILGAVQANVAQYDALIRAGAGADEAAVAYDANTQALESQLRQAGLTQGQIDGLIGKYKHVPDQVNTDIATNGLTDAINNLSDMLAYLNHVNGYVARASVTVTTDYVANRQSVYNSQVPAAAGQPNGRANALGGLYEHADVGALREAQTFSAVSSGARYAFAEPSTGGEAFIPKSGDLDRSRAIWGYVGANWLGMTPGRGGTTVVNNYSVTVAPTVASTPAEQGAAVVTAIKRYEQANGTGWRA